MARNKTHAGITGWVCSFLGAAPTGSQQRAAATNGPKQGPAFLLLVGQHRGQVGGQLCEEGWPKGAPRDASEAPCYRGPCLFLWKLTVHLQYVQFSVKFQ